MLLPERRQAARCTVEGLSAKAALSEMSSSSRSAAHTAWGVTWGYEACKGTALAVYASFTSAPGAKHAAHDGGRDMQVKALEAARYAEEQEEAHREAMEERARRKQAHQQ